VSSTIPVCAAIPPEGSTRFDRLQLLGIPDQDDFGAGRLRPLENASELPSAHQTRLVDHQHIAFAEQVIALRPTQLPTGERARGDSAGTLQVLRRDARQGRPLHGVAGSLPGSARRLQHGALAGPGHPDQHGQIRRTGHMLKRLALLRRKPPVRQHLGLVLRGDGVLAASGQALGPLEHRAFELNHLPRRPAGLTTIVDAQGHQVR
jgi:hypothetical protein